MKFEMKNFLIFALCILYLSANAQNSNSNKMFNLLVKFTIKPESIAKFKEACIHSLKESRKEAGNIEMKLYADNNKNNVFYVYSRWDNKAAYEFHKTLPHSKNIAKVSKVALIDVHIKSSYSEINDALLSETIIGNMNQDMNQDINQDINFVTELETKINNILNKNWETTGFAMPESVVADPNSNWVYVSNIVNNKTSGYISRVSKSGKVDNYKWLEGLNQPCGLAIYGNLLYAGDQDKLHIIDIEKGEIIKSLSTETAMTLNDVAISKNGQVFISDVMSGKIFTIKNDKLVVWIENTKFTHPNGLYVDGENLIVADLGNKLNSDASPLIPGSVYKVNISDKGVTLINPSYQLGGLDGIVKVGNNYVITNNSGGELYAISDKERLLLGSFSRGIADLGSEGQTIYIPNFAGTVSSYSLKTRTKP